ncbi:uL15 family ribosomal protein [Candidatus Kaiserbacteria bacterium]|nr:uL15 family ribosomal protein [Candidatus Kaiserbacteria bacterium]
MASLHTLVRIGKRAYRRVGRGNGSSRGKQSGRGGKGQTARAGHKVRPEMRDIIKKLPKRRGYGKNRGRTVDGSRALPVAVSVTRLDKMFESGAAISWKILQEKGVVGRKRVPVKIVGGETSKKFTVSDCEVSSSARAAIEKAGGTVAAAHSSVVPKVKKATKPKKVKKEKKEAPAQTE